MLKIIRIILLMGLILTADFGHAEMAPPPQPPANNPHPPLNKLDKKRVAFGELVVKTLLTIPQSDSTIDKKINLNNQELRFHLDETCLKDKTCVAQSKDLAIYLKSINKAALGPFPRSFDSLVTR